MRWTSALLVLVVLSGCLAAEENYIVEADGVYATVEEQMALKNISQENGECERFLPWPNPLCVYNKCMRTNTVEIGRDTGRLSLVNYTVSAHTYSKVYRGLCSRIWINREYPPIEPNPYFGCVRFLSSRQIYNGCQRSLNIVYTSSAMRPLQFGRCNNVEPNGFCMLKRMSTWARLIDTFP
eukprot:gnl/Trimastix_PCT/499.p1 GENE.gnl/Trimastix_PCT/499~~gnl/Trimastix_PCT/499.p1  ORF type:complete len:181 (+),score=13.39 gnl/Trimastix_PCT/499:41-583(+)